MTRDHGVLTDQRHDHERLVPEGVRPLARDQVGGRCVGMITGRRVSMAWACAGTSRGRMVRKAQCRPSACLRPSGRPRTADISGITLSPSQRSIEHPVDPAHLRDLDRDLLHDPLRIERRVESLGHLRERASLREVSGCLRVEPARSRWRWRRDCRASAAGSDPPPKSCASSAGTRSAHPAHGRSRISGTPAKDTTLSGLYRARSSSGAPRRADPGSPAALDSPRSDRTRPSPSPSPVTPGMVVRTPASA